MRFWISRKSEVSVREQLTAQIVLAITSGELGPGAKLASTRALARQLGIHANTVGAAYRELASRGWLEQRKGSGAYVRAIPERRALEGPLELDRLITDFIRVARNKGFSLAEIRGRAKHWLELQPPDHLLVVEDDVELRRILLKEIGAETPFPIRGASLDQCRDTRIFVGAQPIALYGRSDELVALLPSEKSCLWLQTRSVREELERILRPVPPGESVGVISHWPEFLHLARTILLAAGLDPDALSFHDARQPDWRRALRMVDFIVADAVTADELPRRNRTRTFTLTLLPEASRDQLRDFLDGLR
jgi:DNA-binding transcriptional regulator YhcF (GntR family)